MTTPAAHGVKVFLDASVIIAALLSPSGGSFRLLQESHDGRLKSLTNRYVHAEVMTVLARKYPAHIERWSKLISWGRVKIQSNPSGRRLHQVLNLIHPEDAAVLAGALQAKADFMVSLDQRDFLTQRLRDARLPIIIATPRQFFQAHWIDGK